MGVVGSVVRGTDDGRSMGGGREVFVVRVRRVEGCEDSGRVEGSLGKVMYNVSCWGYWMADAKVRVSLETYVCGYLLGSCNTKVVSSVVV